MKNRKVLLIYTFLFTFFIIAETSCSSAEKGGEFVFVNGSSEVIRLGEIEVCGQKFEYKNLGPSESFSKVYRIKGDCHYTVRVTFASGERIEDELGYITSGFRFKHTIRVTTAKVTISDTKVE